MFNQNRETLPAAPLTNEDLMRRIQNEKEISEQIIVNSYNAENVTDEMLKEFESEFEITHRHIGHLGIQLARQQAAV
jgi:hypothetical protein